MKIIRKKMLVNINAREQSMNKLPQEVTGLHVDDDQES